MFAQHWRIFSLSCVCIGVFGGPCLLQAIPGRNMGWVRPSSQGPGGRVGWWRSAPTCCCAAPEAPFVRGSHPPPSASILSCGRTSLQEGPWPEYAEGEVSKRRILIRGDAAVAAHLTTAEGWALRAQHLRKCVHGMTKSLFVRHIAPCITTLVTE